MTAETVRDDAGTTQQSAGNHESNGQFAAGNKGGPGNPFARQVAALKQALLNCVTPEDIKEHARKLNEKAKRGDVAATRLLWQYTLGKPAPTPNPDQLDADEWRNLRQYSCPPAEMNAIFDGFPANVANELTKACWPSQFEMNFGKAFRHGIQKMDERDARRAAKAKTEKKAAPSTNGSNGEPQAAGVVPLPDVATSELDAYFMQHLEGLRPSTNDSNGDNESLRTGEIRAS
jgi:hypothetical protein